MLAKKVIATGITHLTDARYFAAWEVDYLCFLLGENGISLDYMKAMREWVQGPVIVAELGADAGANGYAAADLVGGGVTHVLLPESTEAASYEEAGLGVITHLAVEGYHDEDDLAERLPKGAFLLDFTAGGIEYDDLRMGRPLDLNALQKLIAGREAFVSINAPDEDPKTLPFDLAVRGSSEEKVGYKSFDDVDDLFEALEV